ncbi:Acetylcholinesterase [Daldinia childiae]|uniref:Acetylcholinesterase n=1 Tax=Daldinia childiae TaxID=326645 RepID=UPI001447606F|nr:Acetylcholinesterase [Daldinia childiae]KAF3066592.1 Acetylcholinesterase [Daldinia childiae]
MNYVLPQSALIGLIFLILGTSVVANAIVKLHDINVTYHGLTSEHIEHFYNIKFGHDTSGERRFAPPELYVPQAGSELDATVPGLPCPQLKAGIPPFFDEIQEVSEDCLNLWISRPAGTTAKDKLPVVLWIPGGGVIKSSAHDSHADPKNLITLSTSLAKPVIFVSLNFRVTIFGFARLSILKEQKSLNVGMRDQRLGFQWVKDNIASFGGDPERITVFGVSAGGTFSSLHTMAFGGEKGVPFTQAWAISGPPGTTLSINSDMTDMHTRGVAEKLECNSNEEEVILKCLREVPMGKLVEVAMEYSVNNHPPLGLFTFIPSVDADFLPDRPSVLYRSGRFVKGIPMIFGWTQNDGATNILSPTTIQREEDMKDVIKSFPHSLTDEDYEALFSHYPSSAFEEDLQNYEARKSSSDPTMSVHYFRVSRILRDILFTCPSIDFGYEVSRQSSAIDPTFPGVRLYALNQSMLTPLLKAAGMPYVGVAHGSDTNYIFNGLFPEGQISKEDKNLSRSVAASLIYFAYTGNPTYADNEGFSLWPESFAQSEDRHLGSDLSRFNLQLIGGPLGTGSCFLRKENYTTNLSSERGSMQVPFMADVEFGEMDSIPLEERQQKLKRQNLFERCAYIRTLNEKLGV